MSNTSTSDGRLGRLGRRRGRSWAAGASLLGASVLGLLGTTGPATAEGSAATSLTAHGGLGPSTRSPGGGSGRRLAGAATAPEAQAAVVAAEQAAVAAAEQDFGLRLLDETASVDPTGDVTVSPFSLADALAMLENGAEGATLQQIAATLGTTSFTPTEQDLGWLALTTGLSAEARRDGVSLDSADGLWLQAGFPLRAPFVEAMQHWFGTEVSKVDFAHHLAAALGSINGWVSAHTGGKITQLFNPGEVGIDTRLVLASAVYFHAAWQDPFDPARTVPSSFTLPGGTGTSSVPVEMMTGTVAGGAATAAYDVARLPYRGGHDEAVVMMPLHMGLPAFLRQLDPARLDSITAAAARPALVQLPRFTTTSDLDLVPTLSEMGMPIAFTRSADLSALSPVPTMVQSVVQRDYLKVAEAGTEAAAATGIGIAPTAVAVPTRAIVFDHPFLFVVRNTTTGAILFASAVEDPSSSAS